MGTGRVLGLSFAAALAFTMHATVSVAAPAQTINDPKLGVTWLADADLPASMPLGLTSQINADGSMPYATAQMWVRRLDRRDYLGHDNWTLPVTQTPNIDTTCSSNNHKHKDYFGLGCSTAPLASLYKYQLRLTAPSTAVSIADNTTGPFNDFQPYLYWTDVAATNPAQGFQTFSFNTGWPGANTYSHYMYVLPMIPGNAFGATGATGATLISTDGGSAVYEPGAGPMHAGVTWMADADYARTQSYGLAVSADGSMEEPTAVTWMKDLAAHTSLGWTFPTRPELQALYSALKLTPQQPVVPVPDTTLSGFQEIQPYLYWSCAGASVDGPCRGTPPTTTPQQWSFSFGNGFLGTDLLANSLYVMVYYPNPRPLPPKPVPPPICRPPLTPAHTCV